MEHRICKHFGVCGGCKLQDLDYQAQLAKKQQALSDVLEKQQFKKLAEPIIGSPRIYYYRNKMEFSFSRDNGSLICGLHSAREKRKIVDLEECIIFSEDAPLIMQALKGLFQEKGFSVYSTFSHKGFLRHLVVREAKNTQDIMLNIVTSSQGDLNKEEVLKRLLGLRLQKRIASIVWTVSDALSDAVVAKSSQILYGCDHIREDIGDLSFKILPFSFFQVNPYILGEFYARFKGLLGLDGREKIIDLFSGVGTISLILARESYFIWAVEQSQEATENARLNLALNNINNVSFLSGNARKVLWENMHSWKDNIDIIVLNPPRSGLAKKVIQRVKEVGPKRIIYSSCNPKTFCQDIKEFLDVYSLKIIQPFDFFPHTPHLEVLCLLEK